MSSIPIVVVSASVRREPNAAPFVRLRATYIAALESARLVPVITSPGRDESDAESLLQRVDGLVLTGGEDINPARFGASPHPKLGVVADERDSWEIALVRTAARLRIPTLAICRGIQVVNVALGGTLIQDLRSEHSVGLASSGAGTYEGGTDHDPELPRASRSHPVEIDSDSRTARAIGVTHLRVNSVHHQAIERAGPTLRVVATAPDGVIEAVESSPDSPWWCVGVQWHPEDLVESPEPWERSLFAAFADAVRERRAR